MRKVGAVLIRGCLGNRTGAKRVSEKTNLLGALHGQDALDDERRDQDYTRLIGIAHETFASIERLARESAALALAPNAVHEKCAMSW